MRTIAFNLSEVKTATTYYFDNFVLEIDGAHYMKLGDVNGDDNVTPADAIEALYIYFGSSSGGNARATLPMTGSSRDPE